MNSYSSYFSLKNNYLKTENRELLLMVTLFLIAPFVIFTYALFTYQKRNSQIIIVLFTALFGYNMIAESESMDLARNFDILKDYNHFSLFDILKNYYDGIFSSKNSNVNQNVGESQDLYIALFAVIVSRFTVDGKVLMAVFGLLYGYVFVKSMQKFIEIQPKSLLSNIPFLCAAFMMPLAQLAGIRYPTATYLFFWGVISILNTESPKYYFLLLLACITHFSFIIPIFIFIVFHFFSRNVSEKKIKITFFIFIISFFFPNLILNLFTNNLLKNIAGAGLQYKTDSYTNVELNTEMATDWLNSASWYALYPIKLVFWFVYGAVFMKYIPFLKLRYSILSDKILIWVLVLLSFSNFSLGVSNLGFRLLMVSSIFFFYYLLRLYNENQGSQQIKKILFISLLFVSLKIILETRIILGYTTSIFYYGSVFHIINNDAMKSLWTNISEFLF